MFYSHQVIRLDPVKPHAVLRSALLELYAPLGVWGESRVGGG